MQLVAEISRASRSRREEGARRTPLDERRLVPLAPETLARLNEIAKRLHDEKGIVIAPLQLAGLLLEHAAGRSLAAPRRRSAVRGPSRALSETRSPQRSARDREGSLLFRKSSSAGAL